MEVSRYIILSKGKDYIIAFDNINGRYRPIHEVYLFRGEYIVRPACGGFKVPLDRFTEGQSQAGRYTLLANGEKESQRIDEEIKALKIRCEIIEGKREGYLNSWDY